ncbi:MAG: polysaccharide deacetylase family protein [Fibrobacteria bacterium]
MSGIRVRSFFNQGPGREWSLVFGEGALEDESLRYIEPPMSARLIARDTTSSIIEKILSPAENVCGDVNISLKVSAPSQANLTSVAHTSISLIGGKSLNENADYTFQHLVREIQLIHSDTWTRVNMAMRTFTASPTFDCAHVTRIRLRLNSPPGSQDTLNLGQLSFFPSPLPHAVLLITEDDEWSNFDTNGVPALRKHGFPATIYANGGLMGIGNKMPLERLKVLQDSGGWTIGNHLWLHDSITSLSNDSAERSIRMNADFLRRSGFTGYAHFAYPYGLVDRGKDSIVRLNCNSARLVLGWAQGDALPYADPYRLRVIGFLTDKVNLDMAKAAVRQLVAYRTAGIMGLHEIVTSGVLDGNKWRREDWEELIDYISTFVDAGTLEVLSMEQFNRIYPTGIH